MGASELLLRSVVESLDGALCIVGAGGEVLGTNARWDRQFGHAPTTPDFFAWADAVGFGDLGEKCADLVWQMITNDPGPLSFRLDLPPDGEGARRWLVCRVNPVRDHESARAVVTIVDITESMQTREELDRAQAEAQRQALVARATDDAVVVSDPDGVVEWVNEAFVRTTGYTLAEAVGRHRTELMHGPGTRTPEFQAFRERLAAREPADVEVALHAKDGRAYWANIQVRPVLEEDRVAHLIGVERDVTERRRAEEHLRAAMVRAEHLAEALSAEKARLTGVLSAVPQMVFWKDAARRYVGCNRAYVQFLGRVSEAELIGRDDAALAHDGGGMTEELSSLEAAVLDTEEPVVDRAVHITAPDGTRRAVLLSVLPLRRPGGEVQGLIGVVADVTHAREMERQLAQANRLESIGQLAAGIAHEINTPVQYVADNTRFVADSARQMLEALTKVAAVEGTADALGGLDLEFLAEEVPSALEQSQEGLTRVSQIVRAMKDYAHPGTGRTDTDINRAVRSTVAVARNEYKYVAELELELDEDTGSASCYEGELKQVILNMIVNAAQAIEADRKASGAQGLGTITVATRRIGGEVHISIADDGHGMDEATRQRVFDPFFTTKDVGVGTGQGLSLAHNVIVAKHQGRIDVDTAPGLGTTFTLRLPVVAPDRSPSPTPSMAAS